MQTLNPRPVMADQEKVQATIKQLVRDWSVEGTEERMACYQPIIDEIMNQFPLEYWYELLNLNTLCVNKTLLK